MLQCSNLRVPTLHAPFKSTNGLWVTKWMLTLCLFFFASLGYANPLITKHPPDKTVSGKVTDEKGAPVDGATVLLKGTSVGVTTNAEGVFTIKVPNAGGILVVSHVGFVDQEVAIGNKSNLNITLISSKSEQLTDVVVVGYGKQKK